jgi:hypothetical protein
MIRKLACQQFLYLSLRDTRLLILFKIVSLLFYDILIVGLPYFIDMIFDEFVFQTGLLFLFL